MNYDILTQARERVDELRSADAIDYASYVLLADALDTAVQIADDSMRIRIKEGAE